MNIFKLNHTVNAVFYLVLNIINLFFLKKLLIYYNVRIKNIYQKSDSTNTVTHRIEY